MNPDRHDFRIIALDDFDRHWVFQFICDHWGSGEIVSRGRIHRADALPGFKALQGNMPVGLVTYNIDGPSCEIVSLNSIVEKAGIATELVSAVREHAVSSGCSRLWLITTNDNMHALRFFQKRGFLLAAIHRDAISHSRQLKPQIPQFGIDGIPLRDEIELEMIL